MRNIIELLRNPLQKEKAINVRAWDEFLGEQGDKTIDDEEGCWLVMTGGILEGTRRVNYEEKERKVKEIGTEFTVPNIFEALACIGMQCHTGNCHYSQDPWTFTVVQEKVDRLYLVVGGFAPGVLFGNSADDYDGGVGALWKS